MTLGSGVFSLLLGVSLSLATAAEARADAPGLELSWVAPADCASAEEVESAVERLLEGRASRLGKPLEARVEVWRSPDGTWLASLNTNQPERSGSRMLQAESCRALVLATAVVLALTLEPSASEPLPAKAEAKAAPRRPQPGLPPRPDGSAGRAQGGVAAYAQMAAGGALHWLPEPSVAVGPAIGLQLGRFSLQVGALATPQQSVVVDVPPGAGAKLSVLVGRAEVCFAALRRAAVELGPCLGAELERWDARSFGLSDARSATPVSASAHVALASQLRLTTTLSVVLEAGAGVRPGPLAFRARNVGVLYQVPAVGSTFLGALRYELGRW